MDIYLIDALGPFFRDYHKQRINWSKIPFDHLDVGGSGQAGQFRRIREDMAILAEKVSRAGYNAVSLDDVAHLAPDPWLEPEINQMIECYREEYRTLFAIFESHGLKIYLTMDVLSFTPRLKSMVGNDRSRGVDFIHRQLTNLFSSFDQVAGIIFRIGECDGRDVKGAFRSELLLRTAGQVNTMVRRLLPVFERFDRTMILRTWTIGAYRVGDLIWHHDTTARVLKDIDSSHFILSMKYGDSDFFRYLPLNEQFFAHKVRKIIELQARREYEGCGEYPSFVGWDYQDYAVKLHGAQHLAGISVWCQTGGWVPFRRLTFIEPAGVWNELNAFVTVKIFRERWSVEQAVASFCRQQGWRDLEAVIDFLRLDDQVIKDLLYIDEIARRNLFFRRVRIPPLLNVYWNSVFINHSVGVTLRSLVRDPQRSIDKGRQALDKIGTMKRIAREVGLPVEDIVFMEDTFRLLALARAYYFMADEDQARTAISREKKRYKKRYPRSLRPRYRIRTNYAPAPLSPRRFALLFRIMFRTRRGYRIVDHLFTIHLLGALYRLLVRLNPALIPKFARKQAMGIDSVFR